MDQGGPFDSEFMRDGIRDTQSIFGEPVTIKRWQSKSGGNPAQGTAATSVFLSIRARAVISEMQKRDINSPSSLYAIGDLNAEFDIEVRGGESADGDFRASGSNADQVIYRNREYRIVGHVNRINLSGRSHWAAVLRQVR